MAAPREIHYAGNQIIYNKERVDQLIEETNRLIEHLDEKKQDMLTFDDEPLPESENPVKSKGIYEAIRNAASVPVGETMFWFFSECEDRTVHSDKPFEFDVQGKHYSVDVPDAVIHLNIATEVPECWHALDGKAELNADEYPDLARLMPNNITNDGKIWLPYVQQKIIKVRY